MRMGLDVADRKIRATETMTQDICNSERTSRLTVLALVLWTIVTLVFGMWHYIEDYASRGFGAGLGDIFRSTRITYGFYGLVWLLGVGFIGYIWSWANGQARQHDLSEHRIRDLLQNTQAILGSAGEGILGIDRKGAIAFANPAAAGMLGWSEDQLVGQPLQGLLGTAGPDGRGLAAESSPFGRVLVDGVRRQSQEECFRRRDGADFAVEYTVAPVCHADIISGAVIVFRDVTDRQLRENQLRLAAKVFEASHDATLITDQKWRILSINPAVTGTAGFGPEDLLGRTPASLLPTDPDRGFFRGIRAALRGSGVWEGEVFARRLSGDIFPAWVSVTLVRDSRGRVTNHIVIFTDMTETTSAAEKIDYLSRYDHLTSLPNQSLLKDYFEMARGAAERSGSGMALICCNIDNFKMINDTLGHSAGDEVLREIAKRLKGCIAIGTGDIVSRQGGDEFLILLADVPAREAVDASIYAIRAVASVPIQVGGDQVSVTVSLGISLYPEEGDSFDLLFQKADAAVYHAKRGGRNIARYFLPTMIDHATERMVLKNDLRKALERNELVVHYQPVIELASGRIIGAEALLRWQSAVHGFLMPGRFIPIAEESGLIVPIGLWALGEVCRQNTLWRQQGLPPLRLAVNISAIQLKIEGFAESVERVVRESGISADSLDIELTESVLISDTDRTLGVVGRLKDIGVSLSIDDFGTGYSCLAYLQRLRVDKLKIDRSFVTDLTTNSENRAIVTAILQIAKAMRLSTVAEGVETEQQAIDLRALGCQEAQGFYYSRAIPAEAFADMVRENEASTQRPPSPVPAGGTP
jgi:diguanylate cyclase (GGDEF)-like protein/PAS domain S-box-containing protein